MPYKENNSFVSFHSGLCVLLSALSIVFSSLAHAGALPEIISFTKPERPRNEVPADAKGDVMLSLDIGADGIANEVRVEKSSGFPPFDEVALASARTAKFKPATDDEGKPIATTTQWPMKFESIFVMHRTCLELSTEVEKYIQENPTKRKVDFPDLRVLRGFILSQNPSFQSVSDIKRINEKADLVIAQLYEDCDKEPEVVVAKVLDHQFKIKN